MNNEEILELMVRRRRQILVHSCIYYEYGTSIVTDLQYDKWARELEQLNKDYPNLKNKGEWGGTFLDWDSSSGFNLPVRGGWVIRTADRLLEYAKHKKLLI